MINNNDFNKMQNELYDANINNYINYKYGVANLDELITLKVAETIANLNLNTIITKMKAPELIDRKLLMEITGKSNSTIRNWERENLIIGLKQPHSSIIFYNFKCVVNTLINCDYVKCDVKESIKKYVKDYDFEITYNV